MYKRLTTIANNHGILQCLTFRKKSWGQLAPKFSFFVARTSILDAKNYINGFSFVKDNGLSLVYIFPKKKVIYLGSQVGDQAWKFGRHWVKPGRLGDPTGRNVEPWIALNNDDVGDTQEWAHCLLYRLSGEHGTRETRETWIQAKSARGGWRERAKSASHHSFRTPYH